MAAGDFSSEHGAQPSEPDYVEPERAGEQKADEQAGPLDPSDLQRVLDETLSEEAEPLHGDELEALRQVARRHRGRPFELQPVAVDLVESILKFRFHQLKLGETNQKSMSEQIATTLVESPGTLERLENFWDQLCESTL